MNRLLLLEDKGRDVVEVRHLQERRRSELAESPPGAIVGSYKGVDKRTLEWLEIKIFGNKRKHKIGPTSLRLPKQRSLRVVLNFSG